MRKPFFPEGQIGIDVRMIGNNHGRPFILALVAVKNDKLPFYQECRFVFNDEIGSWFCGIHELNEEEDEMLQQVWDGERKKLGLL